jgi:hypothetical protein
MPPAARHLQPHYYSVHCLRMKNVTLSADESLIEQARHVAKSQHKSLNDAFREWLHQYASQTGSGHELDALMQRLRHVRSGGRFSREQMNER